MARHAQTSDSRGLPSDRRGVRLPAVFIAAASWAAVLIAAASWAAVLIAAASWAAAGGRGASDEFAREPSWRVPPIAAVRGEALGWLAERVSADPAAAVLIERGRAVWDARAAAAGFDRLDAVMEILALGEPRIAEVWEAAGGPTLATATGAASLPPSRPSRLGASPQTQAPQAVLPKAVLPQTGEPWLDDPAVAGFERDAVRLWLGRQLVRHERYDEALPLLAGLDVATVVDPAALLFHRAACLHWMLESEAATDALDQLLERADDIPVRYERVARLLRADIAALEEESLDHVARRMRDVTRRLGLGRAGADTRRVQDGVVASLDRMIKELEDRQQQQDRQQPSGGGGGGGGAGAPLDESRLAGGGGPGEVKSRDLGAGAGWGNLPPQAREESLQQIGREFPPHYREAIEQYFKRLATGGEAR